MRFQHVCYQIIKNTIKTQSKTLKQKKKKTQSITQTNTIKTGNKRGGNIKSKKTTNVLMDGGYTPRNKSQKKLRTKLY